jgi:hypothetical protein
MAEIYHSDMADLSHRFATAISGSLAPLSMNPTSDSVGHPAARFRQIGAVLCGCCPSVIQEQTQVLPSAEISGRKTAAHSAGATMDQNPCNSAPSHEVSFASAPLDVRSSAVSGRIPAAVGSSPAIMGSLPAVIGRLPALSGSTPAAPGGLHTITERTHAAIECASTIAGSSLAMPERTPTALGNSPAALGGSPAALGGSPAALGGSPAALGGSPTVVVRQHYKLFTSFTQSLSRHPES